MNARERHRQTEETTDKVRQNEKYYLKDKERHDRTEKQTETTHRMKDRKRQRNRQTKKDVCKKN